MQTFRNVTTDEVKVLSADEARDRNPNVWVLVTDVPKAPKTTPKKSASAGKE